MIHLDTHVVVWLYAQQWSRFSARVKAQLETEPLAISPLVLLELTYLHELNKLIPTADVVLEAVTDALSCQAATASFATVVRHAASLSWTRDPFDRLICGHALADGAELMTADRQIRKHFPAATWG